MGRRKLSPEEKKPKHIRKTDRVYYYGYEQGYMKYYNERYRHIVSRGIQIEYKPMSKAQFTYAYNARREEYKQMGKKAGNIIRDVVYAQTTIIKEKQARFIYQYYDEIRRANPDMPLPVQRPKMADIMAGKLGQATTFRDLMRDQYLKNKGGQKYADPKAAWNKLLKDMHYGGDSLYAK